MESGEIMEMTAATSPTITSIPRPIQTLYWVWRVRVSLLMRGRSSVAMAEASKQLGVGGAHHGGDYGCEQQARDYGVEEDLGDDEVEPLGVGQDFALANEGGRGYKAHKQGEAEDEDYPEDADVAAAVDVGFAVHGHEAR